MVVKENQYDCCSRGVYDLSIDDTNNSVMRNRTSVRSEGIEHHEIRQGVKLTLHRS